MIKAFKQLALWVSCIVAPSLSLANNWVESKFHQWASISLESGGEDGYTLLKPKQTKITFQNKLDLSKSLNNQVYLNGSGVALGDVDGDGLCDIYLCGLDEPNELYINNGDWTFREAAKSYGIDCPELDTTGACLADLDGDGDLDLVVNGVHSKTQFFRNDSNKFTRVLGSTGMTSTLGGMSIALADVDGNGLLDIYVTHYRDTTLMDMPNTHFKFKTVAGRKLISSVNGTLVAGTKYENRFRVNSRGGIEENGLPDAFYINHGDFNFKKTELVAPRFMSASGMQLKRKLYEWGLAAMFRDINKDGLPDLFVCNDFDGEDRFWINKGNGQFRLAPSYALRKTSMFSMGIDFADINRDSLDDFFVLDMRNRLRPRRMNQMLPRSSYQSVPGKFLDRPQYMKNTLFVNRGVGVYTEISSYGNVASSDWSWCPVFIDVDLDGFEDLLITNGVERNARHLDTILKLKKQRESSNMSNKDILLARKIFPAQQTQNIAFRNLGNNQFADRSSEWGFDFKGISQGMACGDLDGDGDLDIVVNNLRQPVGIYRNNTNKPRLAVRLKGPRGNSAGIGARIEVAHGEFTQSQEMIAGGRYLSSDDPMRTFAMSRGDAILTVIWPDRKRSIIENVKPNRIYIVDYEGAQNFGDSRTTSSALFGARKIALAIEHKESMKSGRQSLLPWALNRSGPGVAWGDVNQDGWEDIVISDGQGGALNLYTNKNGTFSLVNDSEQTKNTRDGLSVLVNGGSIIQAYSNLEDGLAFGDMGTVHTFGSDKSLRLAAKGSSIGHLAMADVDSDGDLDLFLVGRSMPRKYGVPVGSWIYFNNNGEFSESKSWSDAFAQEGLNSTAVFAQIDSDDRPDLVFVSEWGAPKVFINSGDGFVDKTSSFGLNKFTGLWRGVDVGDFNGDGAIDFIATNRGLNSSYQATSEFPLIAYHGDIHQDGVWDFIETEYGEDGKLYPRRHLSTLAAAMPWITERLTSYEQYSRTTLEMLIGEPQLNQLDRLEATTLQSTVFIREGDRFKPYPLPAEAQYSSAYAPVVADFDNDGHEDIVISQNDFGVHPDEPREDAGLGLLLLGDGSGQFRSVSISESGLIVPGEGRGAAVADYDHDGRTDLIVTQNGTTPRLFQNQTKRTGLRVVLVGGDKNPQGIGATIRLKQKEGIGPKRVVRLGSGYLSQNSPIQVLGNAETATGIIVAWPSDSTGKSDVEFFKLSAGQKEIRAVKGEGAAWPSATQSR